MKVRIVHEEKIHGHFVRIVSITEDNPNDNEHYIAVYKGECGEPLFIQWFEQEDAPVLLYQIAVNAVREWHEGFH